LDEIIPVDFAAQYPFVSQCDIEKSDNFVSRGPGFDESTPHQEGHNSSNNIFTTSIVAIQLDKGYAIMAYRNEICYGTWHPRQHSAANGDLERDMWHLFQQSFALKETLKTVTERDNVWVWNDRAGTCQHIAPFVMALVGWCS
jgi:hypothetical protein